MIVRLMTLKNFGRMRQKSLHGSKNGIRCVITTTMSEMETSTSQWFKGARTNITVNCLDRHLEKRGDQTAILWEGNEPGDKPSFNLSRAP